MRKHHIGAIFHLSLMITLAIIFLLFLPSCKKYLDAPSDKKLVIPSSLKDVQSLLDFYNVVNASYPSISGQSDDDYYLLDDFYDTRQEDIRRNYIWDKEANADEAWFNLYQIVLYANVSLEALNDIELTTQNVKEWEKLKGMGFFFRGYAYYHILQYFASPYIKQQANVEKGVPLRLNSNWNEVSERASLEESYRQIINDFKAAIPLLPVSNLPVSRPSKPAAYASLARTYLAMGDYELAKKYADSVLQLYSTLIDYNTITVPNSNAPFKRFNPEVIFHSTISGTTQLSPTNWKVDSILFESYSQNDLRRTIFFRSNGGFKGDYGESTSSSRFNGIAVDEVYLIRAESEARMGDKDAALNDLNTLLRKRWETGTFIDVSASSADEALSIILVERRKELVARQTRWFDLRRLNMDERFKKTLQRKIRGVIYELRPNDPKYTFYIPLQAIELTSMPQNKR